VEGFADEDLVEKSIFSFDGIFVPVESVVKLFFLPVFSNGFDSLLALLLVLLLSSTLLCFAFPFNVFFLIGNGSEFGVFFVCF